MYFSKKKKKMYLLTCAEHWLFPRLQMPGRDKKTSLLVVSITKRDRNCKFKESWRKSHRRLGNNVTATTTELVQHLAHKNNNINKNNKHGVHTCAHAFTHRTTTDAEYLEMHGEPAQTACSYLQRTYARYYGASISRREPA